MPIQLLMPILKIKPSMSN